MECDNCGIKLPDDAKFCYGCGYATRPEKNIYIALVLTFFITGLGSIYAGETKKGLILLSIRILFAVIGMAIGMFAIYSILVWAYAFYEAYKDVQIANGRKNPKLIKDYRNWNKKKRSRAQSVIGIILIVIVIFCIGSLTPNYESTSHSNSHHHDTSTSAITPHEPYGGVDTSPWTIARENPDWYYDYYDYGDYDEIDEYLESEGYD